MYSWPRYLQEKRVSNIRYVAFHHVFCSSRFLPSQFHVRIHYLPQNHRKIRKFVPSAHATHLLVTVSESSLTQSRHKYGSHPLPDRGCLDHPESSTSNGLCSLHACSYTHDQHSVYWADWVEGAVPSSCRIYAVQVSSSSLASTLTCGF